MGVVGVRALSFVVLFAFVITCTSPSVSTPSATAAPTARSELRIAVSNLGTEALDPILGNNNDTTGMWLLYDPIVGADLEGRKLSKETGIAKDWQVSADGLMYTFSLRTGLKFHNGDDLTAEDVKFTLERLSGPRVVTTEGSRIAKSIDLLTVKSPSEIEVKLKQQDPLFLYRLSPLFDVSGFVVPKGYISQVGDAAFAQKPVGSGPYKLGERRVGASIEYVQAFPQHFAVGKPRFARVITRIVTEESTRIAQLESGDADLADISVEGLAKLEKPGFRVFENDAPDIANLAFVMNRDGEVTKDINLRKALSYGIDREEIAKFLMAGKATATGNMFPGQIGGMGVRPPDPLDPQKARQFLDQTPFGTGGKPLTLQLNTAISKGWPVLRIAQAIQASWKKNLGIDTQINFLDLGAFDQKRNTNTFPPQSVGLITNSGRLLWNAVGATLTCAQARKYACDPDYDKLVNAWNAAKTDAEYNRLAVENEKYLVEHYLAIPLVYSSVHYVGTSQVKDGWAPGGVTASFNLRGLVSGN